jgi:hypothetical protein
VREQGFLPLTLIKAWANAWDEVHLRIFVLEVVLEMNPPIALQDGSVLYIPSR